MSSGSGSTTTVQNADPWKGAQPYLYDIMGQAQSLFNQSAGNTYYPGSTVVPFSPETQAGMGAITARATQGSPLTGAAQNTLQSTIQGDNLTGPYYGQSGVAGDQLLSTIRGEYLDPTQNPAYGGLMQDVRNQVNSQFGAAGRTGSGAHTGAMTQAMMDSAGRLYQQERQNQLGAASGYYGSAADAYQRERTNQLNATQLAPTLAAQDYIDAQALLGVGAQREGLGQQYVDDQLARWNYAQQQPWQNLQNYSGLVTGMGGMGGTSSATQPGAQSNPIGGAIGGAMMGNMLFPGVGGLIGGGLLGGLFG